MGAGLTQLLIVDLNFMRLYKVRESIGGPSTGFGSGGGVATKLFFCFENVLRDWTSFNKILVKVKLNGCPHVRVLPFWRESHLFWDDWGLRLLESEVEKLLLKHLLAFVKNLIFETT